MTNPSFTQSGKVIFLQGAGRLPGPQVAQAFAAQGATVAACDLSPALLDPIEKASQSLPGSVQTYVGDTSRGMPARSILDEVFEACGPIDVLINNPRIALNTTLLDTDEYDWQRTIEANLNGTFLLMRLIARQMVEDGHGVIINLLADPAQCAAAPHIAGPGMAASYLAAPKRAAYAASQMGLLALTQAAAQELMAYNIRVYGVCLPDKIASLETVHQHARSQPEVFEWIGEAVPDQPSPPQYSSTLEDWVLFLCSQPAEAIRGQIFRAASGQTSAL